MTGTLLNLATVLTGGALGLLLGARLPERLRRTVTSGMGLFTVALGLQMFLQTDNALIVLGSLLIGALLGEWARLEDGLLHLGDMLQARLAHDGQGGSHMAHAFLTASLLFCVGPMTILGSLQDGLTGDFRLLAVKSALDGFAALALASTLGPGVLFSGVVILIYQGGLSLLAGWLAPLITDPMMNELTATGGVILIGLAISSLLELRPIRVGSFLPALLVAPLLVALLAAWP